MTVEQSQDLKVRLLRRCKFEPTIAEIMEEWKGMQRQPQRQSYQIQEKRVYDPSVAKALRETKQALQDGTYQWHHVVTPVLAAFAKHWIPDITAAELQANIMEIEQAQRDMKDDYACQRPYVTGLMRHEGMILTCMRHISSLS